MIIIGGSLQFKSVSRCLLLLVVRGAITYDFMSMMKDIARPSLRASFAGAAVKLSRPSNCLGTFTLWQKPNYTRQTLHKRSKEMNRSICSIKVKIVTPLKKSGSVLHSARLRVHSCSSDSTDWLSIESDLTDYNEIFQHLLLEDEQQVNILSKRWGVFFNTVLLNRYSRHT